jgi:sporulation protein YlmC with PRC-barrel domain
MANNQRTHPQVDGFHLGADVYSLDEQHVGTLLSAVVDETSLELQALVVKETKRFAGTLLAPGTSMMNDELLVPAYVVARLARDRVELSLTAAQLRGLPPYLTYKRRYPTFSEYLLAVGTTLGANPLVSRSDEAAREPGHQIEIYPREPVMLGHSGRRIGRVVEAVFEDKDLVGIVIKPEGWFKEPVIMPRRFLERGDDAALFVQLTEEELGQLEPVAPRD